MSHRLIYLASARDDLCGIQRYVIKESGSVAIGRVLAVRIDRKCLKLASLPGTPGQDRSELSPELRSTPAGNYIVFFRYVGDTVEIVNVLEAHRDIDGHFNPDR